MTIDRIRDALTRQPFQPFDLRLVDGLSFTITHPDYLAVPPVRRPRDIIVFTPRPGGDDDEYRAHYLELALILELNVPAETAARPGPAAAEGNGA